MVEDDRTFFRVGSIKKLVRETQDLESIIGKDEGTYTTDLTLERTQEKPSDQEAKKAVPEDKCEEVIPLKRLPTIPM